jgi:hypothetical protein
MSDIAQVLSVKDIPMTQYFDDGKTIMIIDYLVDPFTKMAKEPQFTSTPRYLSMIVTKYWGTMLSYILSRNIFDIRHTVFYIFFLITEGN